MILSGVPRIKITIFRIYKPSDLWGNELPIKTSVEKDEVCPMNFHVGQEFIVEGTKMPEGFCPIAWNQTFWAFMTLRLGGGFSWCLPPDLNKVLECCPEGLRPVIYMFERIEE